MSSTLKIFTRMPLGPRGRWNCFIQQNYFHISNAQFSNGKVFKSMADAVSDIRDGSRLMVGGFGNCGTPGNLLKAISEKGCNNLTVISNNVDRTTLGVLMNQLKLKRVIVSFVGTNPDVGEHYNAGKLEVELSPQGTLVERIRAGGAGIPAFYTPVGFGTVIQDGRSIIKYDGVGNPEIFSDPKPVRCFNGKNCVRETALTADFSIIKAWKADKAGNLVFRKSARNLNPVMCTASEVTIVEVEEILNIGQLDPDEIHVPGIFIDRIVRAPTCRGQGQNSTMQEPPDKQPGNEARTRIIKRAVLELKDGMYVNVGAGLPLMVPAAIPKNLNVTIHSENGILGVGPYPAEDQIDTDLTNAAGASTTVLPGAAFFGSDDSFTMIRGGHLDMTILGGMQVSQRGDLANWILPRKKLLGMGGAMDLVSSEKTKVVVTMEHKARDGSPKVLSNCTLPITGLQCVDLIITDLGVFEVEKGKSLKLIEISPNCEMDEIVASTACDFEVSTDLKVMRQAETDNDHS